MASINTDYITGQLMKAQAVPLKESSTVKIQIIGDSGKTNWFDIDKAAFRAIEDALIAMGVRKDEA